MKNFEKIVNLQLEDLAEMLTGTSQCDYCSCFNGEDSCIETGCYHGILKWLKEEENG